MVRQFILGLCACLATITGGHAQYVGFVYPAGGQQGTTCRVTLGGQKLEGVNSAFVSGTGVKARVVEYNKKMNNQEVQVLNEQLKELKAFPPGKKDSTVSNLMARIEKLVRENSDKPACASIANLVIVEVTIASDAKPGVREIRVGTPLGLSNPLVFNVGQVPEISEPPMATCELVTLGKEEQSVRRRKPEAAKPADAQMMMAPGMMMGGAATQIDSGGEVLVVPPCTVNGQIGQGSVDSYRVEARKGQRLVIRVQARELIPFVADAVPGWFQPVITLSDALGRELAYEDDYRFKPDPVMLYEVPADGEYKLAIYDAIYRGREDFVYRITIGEMPFVTRFFPLGARVGSDTRIELQGWNLAETIMTPDLEGLGPGLYPLTTQGKNGFTSNPLPFALTDFPECLEHEPNSMTKTAQKVTLPIIVNGHVAEPGKKDMFRFEGRAGEAVVAEVFARRLDSPLDSVLKLTDAAGKTLAVNDDNENAASGVNTHYADSYLSMTLPSNGIYYISLNDAQHRAGKEYGYRLRISAPQPDYALRVTPSCVNIRSNSSAQLNVYVVRQEGFTNTVKLAVKGAATNFSGIATLSGTQTMVRLSVKTTLGETHEPVNLFIEGTAMIGTQKLVRVAEPAEDRMQAFLWRHLVPAQELKAFVFNPPKPASK